MLKIIYFTCIFLSTTVSFAQKITSGLPNFTPQTWATDEIIRLEIIEDNKDFIGYGSDISNILLSTANQNVLGYIGNNYQRLKIKFTSVKWNPTNRNQFLVTGKSLVKNVKVPFTGIITIQRYATVQVQGEDTYTEIIKASYTFNEDKKQKYTGVFEGYLSTRFKIEGERVVNPIENSGADGASNNQFCGTWTSYATKQPKPCSWGDYRIPLCGPLDQGAGFFIPAPKFVKNGWENYMLANIKNNANALKIEKQVWW